MHYFKLYTHIAIIFTSLRSYHLCQVSNFYITSGENSVFIIHFPAVGNHCLLSCGFACLGIAYKWNLPFCITHDDLPKSSHLCIMSLSCDFWNKSHYIRVQRSDFFKKSLQIGWLSIIFEQVSVNLFGSVQLGCYFLVECNSSFILYMRPLLDR